MFGWLIYTASAVVVLSFPLLCLPSWGDGQPVAAAPDRAGAAREANTEPWAGEALEFFSQAGVRPEVPLGPTGRPLTRYRFVVLLDRILSRAEQDLADADRRWIANPALTWKEADPPHLQGSAALVRWAVESLRVAASENLLKEPPVLAGGKPSGLRDISVTNAYGEVLRRHMQRGLITGYEDGTFRGEQALTSPEFAMVLLRFSQEIERFKTGRCYLARCYPRKAAPPPPGPVPNPPPVGR